MIENNRIEISEHANNNPANVINNESITSLTK